MADLRDAFQEGIHRYADGNMDAAITAFQRAQRDPDLRIASLNLLGQCFLEKGWYDEAIDTFRRAIECHRSADDAIAIELRTRLMHAIEEQAGH